MILEKPKIQKKLKSPTGKKTKKKLTAEKVVWTYKEDSPTEFTHWKEVMTQEATLTCT